MSNLHTPAAEWLAELFEFEWCAECGRGAAGHTAIPFVGNWFARCDHPPQFDGSGNLIINPGGEADGPCAEDERILRKGAETARINLAHAGCYVVAVSRRILKGATVAAVRQKAATLGWN